MSQHRFGLTSLIAEYVPFEMIPFVGPMIEEGLENFPLFLLVFGSIFGNLARKLELYEAVFLYSCGANPKWRPPFGYDPQCGNYQKAKSFEEAAVQMANLGTILTFISVLECLYYWFPIEMFGTKIFSIPYLGQGLAAIYVIMLCCVCLGMMFNDSDNGVPLVPEGGLKGFCDVDEGGLVSNCFTYAAFAGSAFFFLIFIAFGTFRKFFSCESDPMSAVVSLCGFCCFLQCIFYGSEKLYPDACAKGGINRNQNNCNGDSS